MFNADGTSLTESTSPYSAVRTVSTAGFANNAFGRTRNFVSSLTEGVVTPVLLYEAPELVEVTVTVSSQTNLKSNYSVGLSSSFGFKDSDYLAYGIPIAVGEAKHLEKIHMALAIRFSSTLILVSTSLLIQLSSLEISLLILLWFMVAVSL